MYITTKFDIGQEVGIKVLNNRKGTIQRIIIEGKNLFYEVEVWEGIERKAYNFYETELSEEINEVCDV